MKKLYSCVAVASMMFAAVFMTSCGDDSSSSSSSSGSETYLPESQWKSSLPGTWTYASGQKEGTALEDGSAVYTQTWSNTKTITFSKDGTGTYTKDYTSTITYVNGAPSTNVTKHYTVDFTYEYKTITNGNIWEQASVTLTVTSTDNSELCPVGTKIYYGIKDMTDQGIYMLGDREDPESTVDYTKFSKR